MNRQRSRRIAACVASLVLTVALSGCGRMEGSLAEPVMEPEVIVEVPVQTAVAPRSVEIKQPPDFSRSRTRGLVIVQIPVEDGGRVASTATFPRIARRIAEERLIGSIPESSPLETSPRDEAFVELSNRGLPPDLARELADTVVRFDAGEFAMLPQDTTERLYRHDSFGPVLEYFSGRQPALAALLTDVPTSSTTIPMAMEDDETEMALSSAVADDDLGLPRLLPWPPPNPSLAVTLRREPIVQAVSERFGEDSGDLRSVGWLIEDELSAAGYDGKIRYVGLNPETGPRRSDEFALVTGMEQIDENARPLEGPARWSRDIREEADISILGFLRALFTAPRGNYRVLVFVVTPRALQGFDSEPLSTEAVGDIETGGAVALPEEFAEVDFAPIFQVYALVYEFEKTSDQGEARHAVPGRWRASDHLAAAGAVASWVPGNQQ